MDRFRPQRWLRIFGVLASTAIAARHFVDRFHAGPEVLVERLGLPASVPAAAVFRGVMLIEALAFAGFLAAFLYSTRSVEPRRSSVVPVLVLLVQLPLALTFGVELAIVATTAVPFVLAGRAAYGWLAAEIIFLWIDVMLEATQANMEMSPGLSHTPFATARLITLIEATGWLLFGFCTGYLIVRAERNRRDLASRNAELEATLGLLAESSALNERMRISRELHDTVGHHLVGLSVNLELASHLVSGGALAPVQRARLVAKLLLADIRETVSSLRGDQRLDLAGALRRLIEGVEDVAVHLDFDPAVNDANPALSHFLFRCAQESITNARKHARARNLWVSLGVDHDGYRVTIRDDGRGCAGPPAPGNGLRGMRERAREIGADIGITTGAGKGFIIEVRAPRGAEVAP